MNLLMIIRLCLLGGGLLLLPIMSLSQQDSTMLDKDFSFRDGIYLSVQDFQSNQPVYTWDEIEAQLVTVPSSHSAQADYIKIKEGEEINADDIWGISLNGMPYVCLVSEYAEKNTIVFAALQVRGRLCYYTYEKKRTEWVEIAAYNPLTGRPFRKGKVSKEIKESYEYILNFTNGETEVFNKPGLLNFIKDDEQLWRTVNELSPSEVEQKLYKCLLIYDDRNPVFVPE